MDDDSSRADESLSLAALSHIDRACLAFEESCKSGEPTPLETFLTDVEEPVRSSLLRELLLLELDYRCRRGESPDENDYIARFPKQLAVVADVFARGPSGTNVRSREVTAAFGAPATPPTAATPKMLPEKIGRYTVLEELGHGGFGTVYLARDEELQRQVAIKIPRRERFKSPEQLLSFFEEARTAAQLKHDGIVPIHDVGRLPDDSPFVVMEYLEGESLETTLQSKQLTYRQIAELLAEIADAVHYAHRRGVVHRDLKPSNIISDTNGRPCITDFGLAERWDPATAESSANTPALAGTAQFIPPEVYTGTGVMGPAIDVYALGVILYQALTGRYPFEERSLDELQEQILAGVPPLPQEINPNIPEKLQRICLKALEHHACRYDSAEMLADELRRFLQGREVLARPLRYDAELRGKLKNHYAAIHSWRDQNLITVSEMDRLLRPYWFLLQSDSPWPSLARLYPLETITIRLGGWLVLLSTLLWPYFYWEKLETAAAKVACVALPTIALNGVGWTFWHLRSKWNARVFLGTGALLLPLLVVVVLEEFGLLPYDQGESKEMFSGLSTVSEFSQVWSPKNAQFTVAAAAFLTYCVFLLRHFPGKLFAIWWAIGMHVSFTGCLALCGLKEWMAQDHVARALVCYLFPCLLLLFGSLSWDRLGHRSEAAMLYVFFPIPLAVLLTLLAYHGSVEWLGSERGDFHDQTINLWWMANSLLYAAAAVLSQRTGAGYIRFWSTFFAVLVPLSVLLPCNLLIGEPWPGWRLIEGLGGAPVTAYELLCGLAAISFIILGTIANRPSLSVTGLVGLAVFVFRFTNHHLESMIFWPLGVALAGGIAMLAGVASAAWRARNQDRTLIQPEHRRSSRRLPLR